MPSILEILYSEDLKVYFFILIIFLCFFINIVKITKKKNQDLFTEILNSVLELINYLES